MSTPPERRPLSPFDDDTVPAVTAGPAPGGSGQGALRCPHCGSEDVRLSHRHAGDSSRATYRCRTCKRHFRVESPLPRRKLLTGLAVAAALAIAVVFGLFQEHDPRHASDPTASTTDDGERLGQLQAAAKRGDLNGQFDLGRLFWQRGEYAQALPWLQAAAGRNHPEAEYLLGMAYLQGRGTVQNYRSALAHFTKGAELGQLDAQYQLGLFYRDGLATEASKETAYLWLNLAAAQGHPDALILRDKLAAVMPAEELMRAQEASEAAIKRFIGSAPATPAGTAEAPPQN